MVTEYWIPICIALCMAGLIWILLHALLLPAEGCVEIIICGDESRECVERTVLAAKRLSQRYFKDARVYIRGGEDTYVNALCKRYDICRRG